MSNADQITYWNSPAGERWATLQAEIDAVFAPLTEAALSRAAARPGERVLDIGCGCGTTSLALGRTVGEAGSVLGVDISQPMLAVARGRGAEAGLGQVGFELSDAATHRFEPASRDLVFSRFGVMFFADPAAAFANMRTALNPGGRLAFACWRPLEENAWFRVPFAAALSHLPAPEPTDPHAPGPFAFADPQRVRSILTEAGFVAVEVVAHDTTMRLGAAGAVGAAAGFAVKIGPTARLLAGADPAIRTAALLDIRAALQPYDQADGIVLGGAVWLVSARAP